MPIGRGLAWEPYPTSRRLVVWSVAWHLLGGDTELAAVIARHAGYLADHLERDLDNNHLVANAKALAWVGLLFPMLPQAQRWRSMGLELLWETLAAQVRGDGGHVENSSSYHLAVWLDGLETALLCQACDEPVPAAIWNLLARMGDYALALRRPDGRLPLLNDSIEDEPLPVHSLFALASIAFDRPDFDLAARTEGMTTPALGSKALTDSGYVVLRSGKRPTETYLVFDAGDLGPIHCPGHGHADTLSFELWSRGEPLVVDPGTYQYPAGYWRDYFRRTASHSTATVDGVDQSCFVGPFRVADMARGRLVAVRVNSDCREVVGEHDGYTRLTDPVVHRRHILFYGPNHITLQDSFSGNAVHQISLRFHLAPCHAVLQGSTSVLATYPGSTKLEVHVDSVVPGVLSIEEGWVSHTWYQKAASPVLAYSIETTLPITITTHLRIR